MHTQILMVILYRKSGVKFTPQHTIVYPKISFYCLFLKTNQMQNIRLNNSQNKRAKNPKKRYLRLGGGTEKSSGA